MYDCIARGLPPGAKVTVNAVEVGSATYVVDWLPPADASGDVPFPYRRPDPGAVIFTVTGGGVTVTWQTIWP
jgi:hypothetical protein